MGPSRSPAGSSGCSATGPLIQRCVHHERRNFDARWPDSYTHRIDRQLAKAFNDFDPERGPRVARGIAAQLEEHSRRRPPACKRPGGHVRALSMTIETVSPVWEVHGYTQQGSANGDMRCLGWTRR